MTPCAIPNTPYLHTFEWESKDCVGHWSCHRPHDGIRCKCGATAWKGITPWEVFEMIQKDKEGMLQEVKRFI